MERSITVKVEPHSEGEHDTSSLVTIKSKLGMEPVHVKHETDDDGYTANVEIVIESEAVKKEKGRTDTDGYIQRESLPESVWVKEEREQRERDNDEVAMTDSSSYTTKHEVEMEEGFTKEREMQDVAQEELYEGHAVEGELVVSQVTLQPPDVTFPPGLLQAPMNVKDSTAGSQKKTSAEKSQQETQRVPGTSSGFPCSVCHEVLKTKSGLMVHERSHVPLDPDCELCTTILDKRELLKHKRSHKKDTEPGVCDICNKQFRHKRSLYKHKVRHAGITYPCDRCTKVFKDKAYLADHKRRHELWCSTEKPFVCDICNKGFYNKNDLRRHYRSHTGEKPFQCNFCDKKFALSSYLTIHKRYHTGDKPYSCDVCDRTFANLSHMKAHKLKHTGVKAYSCDVCNKSFPFKATLNIHVRKHTGEKPFSCDVCSKKFAQKTSLATHSRIHTGVKPYTCDICNKQFSQKGNIATHIRRHNGERPFACKYCNMTFTQRAHMTIHVRRIHTKSKKKAQKGKQKNKSEKK